MKLPFTKMHGTGNDFVFFDNRDGKIELTGDQIRHICDRRFGVGCDQLLVMAPSEEADFRMDIFNADGGKVEMCGNGIRCFAKYVLDKKLTAKTILNVETLAGVIRPEVIANHPQNTKDTLWVRVDMGKPVLEGREIPVDHDGLIMGRPFSINLDHEKKIKVNGQWSMVHSLELKITCVSMGNPHCVIFENDVDGFPVAEIGPQIEDHPFFPNRTNVEFVEVLDRSHVKQRTWERGAGETMACGTGACAVAVACVLNNKTAREMTVHLKGGDLEIFWDDDNDHVTMTGPATTVFEGTIEI